MKKLFLAMLVSMNLIAATAINEDGAYQLNRHHRLFRSLGVGTQLLGGQWLKAQYDFSVSGGAAGNDIILKDHEGQPVKLPDNAIIDDCLIDVITAPDSSTDSGRIAFSSNAVGDLKADALASSYSADTRVACIPVGNVSTAIKMGSEATLKMRIGSEALTAGKINIWVSYVVSN